MPIPWPTGLERDDQDPPAQSPMNGWTDHLLRFAAVIGLALRLARWVDAYRLAADIPLPLPLEWRLVLARYNLLAVSTHIYKAYQALKRPTGGDQSA